MHTNKAGQVCHTGVSYYTGLYFRAVVLREKIKYHVSYKSLGKFTRLIHAAYQMAPCSLSSALLMTILRGNFSNSSS